MCALVLVRFAFLPIVTDTSIVYCALCCTYVQYCSNSTLVLPSFLPSFCHQQKGLGINCVDQIRNQKSFLKMCRHQQKGLWIKLVSGKQIRSLLKMCRLINKTFTFFFKLLALTQLISRVRIVSKNEN